MNKSTKERRELVERQDDKLSMRRQCDLLSIHRSGLYYKPIGESEFNLELMRLIDEEFMRYPFKGSPQMFVNSSCASSNVSSTLPSSCCISRYSSTK